MIKKIVVTTISSCNSQCPHFYHNFNDGENVWCDILDRKVSEYDGSCIILDFAKRPIPKECPLNDAF